MNAFTVWPNWICASAIMTLKMPNDLLEQILCPRTINSCHFITTRLSRQLTGNGWQFVFLTARAKLKQHAVFVNTKKNLSIIH